MTGSTPLEVSGGAAGIEAKLDDLDAAGALLARAGLSCAELATGVAAIMLDPALALTAAVAPVSLLVAQRALLAAGTGPHGLLPVGAGLLCLGSAARAAAAAYRGADQAVSNAFRQARNRLAWLLGEVSAPVLAPILGVALPAGLAAGGLMIHPGPTPPGSRPVRPGPPGVAGAEFLSQFASRHADLVEDLVGAIPAGMAGLVAGAADDPSPAGRGVPVEVEALAAAGGRRWPPRSVPDAAAVLAGVGTISPLLRESGRAQVRQVGAPRAAAGPRGVSGIVAGLQAASTESDWYSPGHLRAAPQARIRVQRLGRPGGGRAWIVSIPGTRVWSPVAGDNPLDLTGNIRAMAQEPTAAGAAVLAAMSRAGVRPGEPVLLAGHSQGGMIAAALAADPGVRRRYDITHVLTLGSPVAGYPVPESVRVLSIEHQDDLVPRLDGQGNPATANWVTVHRQALQDPATRALSRTDPMATHEPVAYRRTAQLVDSSPDASLADWRRSAAPFLGGGASTVWDLDAERVTR